ncbi:MAG TPA: DUF4231 domain-containing protein [Edaphobacter sp.]|jgi:hypothetical protein|nr:DUF4231 domain-containing protein [Edaphobacter sp.]
MPENASLTRLDDQINWYDRRSRSSQVGFKALKIITIAIAALITINPLFVPSQQAARVAAVMGALVLLCEGIQQLNQYQANWISYRSTCESLKHEKFLFLALSGPYASTENPQNLLAERIESLVSQEHAKWASAQEQKPERNERAEKP